MSPSCFQGRNGFTHMSHLLNVYARQQVAFTHGEGVWLFDETGKRYLDALAGIAVSTLGHNHPRLTQAIAEQAACVLHTSNLYRIPAQEELAARLCKLADLDAAFFCNSGAEANEAAIKLARFHGHQKGIDEPQIVVMEGAFHGRTLATLAATAGEKIQAGFGPLPSGFVRVPYNDLAAIEALAQKPAQIAAVLLEPIQGEGGIRLADATWLQALAALCREHDWLLMFDEVQCGIGRTGHWFGWQQAGVRPDVMTLAKGLGGGVPIGACLAAGKAARLWQPGNHGSTFGGNPLACAAALATLAVIEEEQLLQRATDCGQYLQNALRQALASQPLVRQIRGAGLMIGIELTRECTALVEQAREAGILLNVTAGNVIRLLPALVFDTEHADLLATTLARLIERFADQPAQV